MLQPAINSALSGIWAATTAIQIHANNVANSQTPGFQASRPVLATRPSLEINHGSGPIEVGSGVQVVGTELSSAGSAPVDALTGETLSDTDLASEFIYLDLASTMFRANLGVLRTVDDMLDDLFALPRR